MPHAEIRVQNDPIHAIVTAAQQILIESAQPIRHGGRLQIPYPSFKLPRRGHFFAATSAKKRRWLTDRRPSPTKVADEMCFLVIEQLPGTNKACGCDHNNGNPEKDDGEPVVTAKRPRQPFQLQSASRIKRVRICHSEHKQVELFDDEPECRSRRCRCAPKLVAEKPHVIALRPRPMTANDGEMRCCGDRNETP